MNSTIRKIDFSGYQWMVKEALIEKCGPGPNYFSASQSAVWVDKEGLHLKIFKEDDKWYSTEVYLEKSLGYGKYNFYVKGNFVTLDKNIVLGLFTWDDNSKGNAYNREIDIEVAKWNDEKNCNLQFVVQPYEKEGNMLRFDLIHPKPTQIQTYHFFDWECGKVDFASYHLNLTTVVNEWTYRGEFVPNEDEEKVHINFWLFQGNPPSNLTEYEMIIEKFEFLKQ